MRISDYYSLYPSNQVKPFNLYIPSSNCQADVSLDLGIIQFLSSANYFMSRNIYCCSFALALPQHQILILLSCWPATYQEMSELEAVAPIAQAMVVGGIGNCPPKFFYAVIQEPDSITTTNRIRTAIAKRQEGLQAAQSITSQSAQRAQVNIIPRRWQIAAAQQLLDCRDVFVVTGTGSGKSLCYQLALIAAPGKSILAIFPLISLMTDQVYPTTPMFSSLPAEYLPRIQQLITEWD